jgi:enoyl-CoA hydratase
MRRHSPTALMVTLRALREAKGFDTVEQALRAEFRIMSASLLSPDFREGIRAQLIDRDRTPKWSPPTLADVTASALHPYFTPLGNDELVLGAP